jgi:hypothetical protein
MGRPGPGWVREDDVRTSLGAIEAELALALPDPKPLTHNRLLRLRLLLIAVQHTDAPFPDALASFRTALQEPPPPLA